MGGMRYETGTASEPASWLTSLKSYGRIDFADHDTLLARHLAAAREWFERQSLLITVSRTITLYMDAFPPGVVEVRRLPVSSITQVGYTDATGASAVLNSSLYQVSLGDHQTPCRILPISGQAWPSTYSELDAVQIDIVAGWATITDMPELFLDCILSRALDLYNNQVGASARTMELLAAAKWGGLYG